MNEYETITARGELRVKPLDDQRVGLNVFGIYAQLSPTAARELANALDNAADEAQYGPLT